MNPDHRKNPESRGQFLQGMVEGLPRPKSPFEFTGVRNYFLRPTQTTVYLKSKENPRYLEELRGK